MGLRQEPGLGHDGRSDLAHGVPGDDGGFRYVDIANEWWGATILHRARERQPPSRSLSTAGRFRRIT